MRSALLIMPVFLVVLLMAGPTNAASIDIPSSSAGRAFVAQDYQLALDEFTELADAYPLDLRIKRYQAICLEKLGENERAIALLDEFVELSAAPASGHYFLGTIHYKLRQSELAEAHFKQVILIDQSSRYAQLALGYLDAISKRQFHAVSAGAPKKWNLFASVGYTEDGGAAETVLKQNTQQSRVSRYLSLSQYLHRSAQWTALFNGAYHQISQSGKRGPSSDKHNRWSGKFNVQKQSTVAGKPATYLGSVGYGKSEVDGEAYTDDWFAFLSARIQFKPDWTTSVSLSRGKARRFDVDGFDGVFGEAKLDRTSLGVEQSIFIHDRKVEIGGGVYLRKVSSNDVDANRDSKGIKLFSRFSLPKEIKLSLAAEAQEDTYSDFNGVGQRSADSENFSLSVLRRFGKHFSIDLSYKIRKVVFSDMSGDTNRNTLGVRFSYVY